MMMSTTPSSIAGYSVSSTARLSRCTSSMKTTSRSPRSARIATRSPLRSRPGPETVTSRVSISAATMCASVDLPSPGAPPAGRGRSARHAPWRLRARSQAARARPPGRRTRRAGAAAASGRSRPRRRAPPRRRPGARPRSYRAPAPQRGQPDLDALLGAALGVGQRRLGLGHREAERDERVARREVWSSGAGALAPPASTASSAAAPSLSRNSTTIRSAVRLPIPETDASSARSPVAMPRCSVSTGYPESSASAFAGPSPDTPSRRTKQPRCAGSQPVERERVVAHHEMRVSSPPG